MSNDIRTPKSVTRITVPDVPVGPSLGRSGGAGEVGGYGLVQQGAGLAY
jgi:hypothetical protein